MKQAYIPRIKRGAHTLSEFTPILREQGEVLYIDTLNWRADFPHRPLVAAYLGYDAKALYITYVVDGQDLRTLSPGDGNYVHEDSCVEFFMQREAGEPILTSSSMLLGYATQHTTSPPPKLSFSARKSSPASSAGRLISGSTGWS